MKLYLTVDFMSLVGYNGRSTHHTYHTYYTYHTYLKTMQRSGCPMKKIISICMSLCLVLIL